MLSRLLAVAMVSLLVVGCSAGGGTGGDEAGERFGKMTEESDCLGDDYEVVTKAIEGSDGLVYDEDWPAIEKRLLPRARRYADSLDELADKVEASEWPEGTDETMKAYAAETRTWARFFHRVGSASDMEEFMAADSSQGPTNKQGPLVRKALGISGPVKHTHEFCMGR